MKELTSDIDFADASYISCNADENDLTVSFNSWDDKTTKIVFKNAIQFVYRGGSFIFGIYEQTEENPFFFETLSSYYEENPENHAFKHFLIIDIEDNHFFETIAENILVFKENECRKLQNNNV